MGRLGRLCSAAAVGMLSLGAACAENSRAADPPPLPQAIADTPVASAATAPARSLRCPRAADPRKRQFVCKEAPFDSARETLSGLLTDARGDLKQAGITPTASYAGAVFGAPSGPGTVPTYAGQLTGAVNVDLTRLGARQGASFYISGIWAQQTNDSSFINTNLFPANSLAAGSSAWVAEMYLQQTLAGGNLTLAAGRLAPGATFATLPVFANYLSAAVAGNPAALGSNDPVFPAPPTNTQWAVQAIYNLGAEWQIAGGVFNNNPNAAAGARRGLDFGWRAGNRGAFFVGQVSWLHNQASNARGLPGEVTLGAFYDSNNFSNLATGVQEQGNWNTYLLAQQQVTGAPGNPVGLTLWGAITSGSPQSINLIPLQMSAGASYQGLVRGRPNDIASIGWTYGKVSNSQPGASAQQTAELNYQWVANGWLTLTVDFQYLWRLNGMPSPGAAVVGLQAAVTF
jgi:hypothetical protein